MIADSLTPVINADFETRLTDLLDRAVIEGEILITRQGVGVAKLIPIAKVPSAEDRWNAIRLIQELARGQRLDGLTITSLRDEGRR